MTLPTKTPANNPFTLPNAALAEAVSKEWAEGKKYSPTAMPLTALAYTAIDKIAEKKDEIVEVLMVYVDSDTLTYRATGSEALAKKQDELWGAVLKWADNRFDIAWQTTSGVMPIDQSPALHAAIRRYLNSLDAWQLAAFCVLSSGYSSLVLAIAVCEDHLSAEEAFTMSRLEEEAQAEQWGRDGEAESRALKMKAEIIAAGQFLRLLKPV
jgi:chaperone required for assembly of F1-ATPase